MPGIKMCFFHIFYISPLYAQALMQDDGFELHLSLRVDLIENHFKYLTFDILALHLHFNSI